MLKIKCLNNEKGVALITSIMLLSLLTIIGFSAMNSSDIELRIAGNERAATQTFNLAEAGIDHAFAQLSAGGDFSSLSSNVNYTPYLGPFSLNNNGQYNVSLKYDNNKKVYLRSHGSGIGNSVATIEVEVLYTEGNYVVPGAISCVGGPCDIDYGTGGGTPNDPNVSGYDHDWPDDFNCSGSDCRQYVVYDDEAPVPAIYLDHGGDVTQGSNVVFWGGDDLSDPPVPIIDDIGTGALPAPDTDKWGTPDSEIISNIGTRDAPLFSVISTSGARIERGAGVLVIDGKDVEVEEESVDVDPNNFAIRGTSFFEGLIIIKNCGTLTASGTPHVYGAILIDATGCPQPYSPFKGNGRPAVIYSSMALNNAFSKLFESHKMSNWIQL